MGLLNSAKYETTTLFASYIYQELDLDAALIGILWILSMRGASTGTILRNTQQIKTLFKK